MKSCGPGRPEPGTQRVILKGERGAKEGHDAVAHHLIHLGSFRQKIYAALVCSELDTLGNVRPRGAAFDRPLLLTSNGSGFLKPRSSPRSSTACPTACMRCRTC